MDNFFALFSARRFDSFEYGNAVEIDRLGEQKLYVSIATAFVQEPTAICPPPPTELKLTKPFNSTLNTSVQTAFGHYHFS